MKESLTFIIPAYNDAGTIQTVVKKTVAVGKTLRIPFTILIIDDKSSDRTPDILKHLSYPNVHVIFHRKNLGYGQTIKELYTKAGNQWLFSLPGDYQIEPNELRKLWRRKDAADMIIGWRKTRHDTPARLRESWIYNALLRILFGLPFHDVNSVRLMKTSLMKSIRLTSTSAFMDAELIIRAVRADYRVIEIPISHRARADAGGMGGKLTTIVPTIKDMLVFWVKTIENFIYSNDT